MRAVLALLVVALLAGCAEPDPADAGDTSSSSSTSTSSSPGGGNGFAVQQGMSTGFNAGIQVDVIWTACEAGFCANATARNLGESTVQVSSICESPWTDRMKDDTQAVAHREPQFMCMAYGRAPFAPGDSKQANFTWDGKLHDGDEPRPAPEGAYTWSIVFWWDDANGGARQETQADIHLVIGET